MNVPRPAMALMIFAVILMFLTTLTMHASMDDAQAMTKAFKTWGAAATIEKIRKFGDTNWTYRVGFDSPQCTEPVTWAGTALTSWDNAYANILPAKLPVIKSMPSNLHVDSGAAHNPNAVSAFFVKFFQFTIDGVNFGAQLPVPQTTPWSVDLPFNDPTVTNGFHVVCGKMSDTEGSYGPVPAIMVKVQ